MGKKQREAIGTELAAVSAEEERVILATGRYIGEGFDDARLDTLFLTLPDPDLAEKLLKAVKRA